MTDPELTRRAEQAYLGALLSGHGRHGAGPGQQTLLTPGDFTDPIHQAIFTALTSQDGAGSVTGWLDRLRGLAERLLSPWARAAATYMTRLPERCPDPANLDAYAAMIADASRHRTAQAPAQPARPATAAQPARQEQPAAKDPVLDGAATWLSDTAAAATPPRRRTPAPAAALPAAASPPAEAASASPEAARLARALRASLPRALRPEAATGDDQDRLASSPAGNAGPAGSEQPAPRSAEELERRLLATVLNDPAEAAAIARWMPPEAFGAAPLRDLYQLACQRLDNGQPVDPLIVAWDASQLPGRTPQDREALARLALQVGALDPAPPAGDALRRAVRADYILTRLAGPTWDTDAEHARQLIPPALSSPRQHGERPPAPVPAADAPATAPALAAGQAATPAQPAAVPQQASVPAAAKSPAPAQPAPAQPATGQPVPAQPARPVQLPLHKPPAPAADRFAQRM